MVCWGGRCEVKVNASISTSLSSRPWGRLAGTPRPGERRGMRPPPGTDKGIKTMMGGCWLSDCHLCIFAEPDAVLGWWD